MLFSLFFFSPKFQDNQNIQAVTQKMFTLKICLHFQKPNTVFSGTFEITTFIKTRVLYVVYKNNKLIVKEDKHKNLEFGINQQEKPDQLNFLMNYTK